MRSHSLQEQYRLRYWCWVLQLSFLDPVVVQEVLPRIALVARLVVEVVDQV